MVPTLAATLGVKGHRPTVGTRDCKDLLYVFAVVNLARHMKVDPERALRSTNRRFRERFQHIERRLSEQGRSFKQSTLEELDQLWEESKRQSTGVEEPS